MSENKTTELLKDNHVTITNTGEWASRNIFSDTTTSNITTLDNYRYNLSWNAYKPKDEQRQRVIDVLSGFFEWAGKDDPEFKKIDEQFKMFMEEIPYDDKR